MYSTVCSLGRKHHVRGRTKKWLRGMSSKYQQGKLLLLIDRLLLIDSPGRVSSTDCTTVDGMFRHPTPRVQADPLSVRWEMGRSRDIK